MKTNIQTAKIIVGSYLALKTVQVCYSAMIIKEPIQLVAGRFIGLMIPLLLAIFAFKNKNIAQWLLAVTIVVAGVSGLATGIFRVPVSQLVMKSIFIILGIYLSLGGGILIRKAQNKESWA